MKQEHPSAAEDQQLADDRFRLVLDSLPDMVTVQRTVTDDDGTIVDFVIELINHQDLPVGRVLRRDLIGRQLLVMVPELRGSVVFDAMVSAVTSGRPAMVADTPVTVRVPGETAQRFASVQATPFRDGLIVVVRDVTERHRNLEEIQRTNDELQAAQHLAHIGVWRVDLERQRLILSDEAAQIVGYELEGEVVWRPGMLLDLLEPPEQRRVADLIGNAASGTFATETRLRTGDGPGRWVSLFGQVVGEAEPGGPAVWGTIQDLTDQRRQEVQLAESQLRLARERAMVGALQEAILPTLPRSDTVDIGATYLPAREDSLVGGDWYDAFLVGDERLVLAVGDVAGHGLPAAALMGQLRNALRGLSFAEHPPVETIDSLNRMVIDAVDDEMATCAVGHLTVASGQLTWVNAGHPPPLVIDPDGTVTFLDGRVSPPLGVDVRVARPTNRRVLEAGTGLVWYSDGLVERRGEHLDIGLARLVERTASAVRSSRAGPAGSQQLSDHIAALMVEDTELVDDVCVLVLRVPSRT